MNETTSMEKGMWNSNDSNIQIKRSGSGINTARDSLRTSSKSLTSGMMSTMSRPLTQQGITGLAGPQTPASGINRLYHDKRYYIALIQNHMSIIKDEIKSLQKQLSEDKLDATNYEECKRQVEQYTKQLSEREETLIVYNTAIECSMYKNSRNTLGEDTNTLRRSNQEKVNQLEAKFSEKIVREEQLAMIQEQIEQESLAFSELVCTFPADQRQHYYTLWEKNEELKNEEEKLRNEINQMKKSIASYEQSIFQNEERRLLYNLKMKFYELNKRQEKLQEENKIMRTPSEEREYLLEQVKQDRADTQTFNKQHIEMKKELDQLKERYNELEDELSEKNSARLNKYKELLRRQEVMDTFLDSFEEVYGDEVNQLVQLRSSIAFSLEYISGNSIESSFDDIGPSNNYVLNPAANKDELKQEYKKLMSQLNMLKYVKNRLEINLEELRGEEEQLNEELATFENFEQAREDLKIQKEVLERERDSLKEKLQATRDAVVEAEHMMNDIETRLEHNEDYKVVKALQTKLENLKISIEQQTDSIENLMNRDRYEELREEVFHLLYNDVTPRSQ